MLITANKQKRQMHYIREGAFAKPQTVNNIDTIELFIHHIEGKQSV